MRNGAGDKAVRERERERESEWEGMSNGARARGKAVAVGNIVHVCQLPRSPIIAVQSKTLAEPYAAFWKNMKKILPQLRACYFEAKDQSGLEEV